MRTENNRILIAVFVALTAVSHAVGYEHMFSVFGLNVYIAMPLMAFMALLGPLAFLIQPDFARMKLLWRQLLILLVPILFPAIWSHVIWIVEQASFSEIRRGYVSIAYMFFTYSAAASFVYAAGEDGGWLYLASMLLANFIKMITVIADGGVGPFVTQFFRLMVTFASDTGPLMAQMELQGVTFGLGIYLLWFLMEPKKIREHPGLFAGTVFFFFLGLKRMAVVAVLVTAPLCLLLYPKSEQEKGKRFLLHGLGILLPAAAIACVGLIYYGAFEVLEKMGISTNGRAMIYQQYLPYMEFSPFFWGNGAGWVDNMRQLWQPEAEKEFALVFHTHNEYLRIYLELGMIGLACWCLARFHLQAAAAKKLLGRKGARICAAGLIYLGINYLMDMLGMNEGANVPLAVLFLSFGLTRREEEERLAMEEKV